MSVVIPREAGTFRIFVGDHTQSYKICKNQQNSAIKKKKCQISMGKNAYFLSILAIIVFEIPSSSFSLHELQYISQRVKTSPH